MFSLIAQIQKIVKLAVFESLSLIFLNESLHEDHKAPLAFVLVLLPGILKEDFHCNIGSGQCSKY